MLSLVLPPPVLGGELLPAIPTRDGSRVQLHVDGQLVLVGEVARAQTAVEELARVHAHVPLEVALVFRPEVAMLALVHLDVAKLGIHERLVVEV